MPIMKIYFLSVFILGSFVATAQKKSFPVVGPGLEVDPYHYSVTKASQFSHACVASAHPLASMVGAAMMKRGGNAFDAAIATQLVLAVVYPNAGNLGGGGFLLARKADGALMAIDFREKAPSKASRDMYLDKNGEAQTKLSQNGHLASGVPGTVAGLMATFKHAKLSLPELVQPAIEIAKHGFVITKAEARGLNSNKTAFLSYNTRPVVFVRNVEWHEGDTLVQENLAATLSRISENGARGFYGGQTARLILKEMKRGGGIISKSDLKQYTVAERTPISANYKGYEVVGFPPPSSGGILLLQMLKMVEHRNIEAKGFLSLASVQLMVEVERRAFADRAEHLGDPDFWKVPVKSLLNEDYLKLRMNDYDSLKAGNSNLISAGVPRESEQTTHLNVADSEGNVLSITTTLNGAYGSHTVVGGAGFLLNNEMDDFSIKPGVPNKFGALGGAANAIAPGKRMLSSMCPVIVLKDGQPFIVIGTPGGTTIPTSIFQGLLNMLDFSLSTQDAINAPKFHHQWKPDEVLVEKSFPALLQKELSSMGYKVTERIPIGRTEVIKMGKGKMMEAVADKRGDDSVSGF
jgi:gamma-glutamyltranspeptidase/glutathione hydrolase